ncbi:MAG: AAA family ATPase [Spirochaetota bacterium]|nr:MAG: AAA family ATPase [Spirochaetota bacterium]
MKEELDKFDIILIVGNYGSGKSSLAKKHFPDRKRINRYEIRRYLKEMTEYGERWVSDDWNEDIEGLIKHIENDIIYYYLERNQKILIDNTSVTKKSRKRYIDCAQKFHKSVACVFINPDISVVMKQNRMREFPVPDRVIVDLYSKTELPEQSEGFDKVMIYKN